MPLEDEKVIAAANPGGLDPTEALEEGGGTLYLGVKLPSKKEWWGTRGHELVINEQALNRSIMVLRFGVFADAITCTILQPNFPFMVSIKHILAGACLFRNSCLFFSLFVPSRTGSPRRQCPPRFI